MSLTTGYLRMGRNDTQGARAAYWFGISAATRK